MFTITSMVIVTLIKNVGKPTFIFTDFLHFILPFTGKTKYFEIDGKKYYYETLPNEEQLKIKYPVILGKFDPLLISYNEKDWILNGKNKNLIWKQAGQIEGVILFSKGLKATWHYKLKNDEVIFEVSEIENLNQSERKQIERKFNKIGKRVFNKDTLINYFGGN